ncbi:MAG: hypothetical protein Q9224_004560 [Gallowayella concinna]
MSRIAGPLDQRDDSQQNINTTAPLVKRDSSGKIDPGQPDPEGTITDWLKREVALEQAFPYLKRKRSDGALSNHSSSASSTSSTTPSDRDNNDDLQDLGAENDHLYPIEAFEDQSSTKTLVDDMATPTLSPNSIPTSSQPPVRKIPTDPQWVASRLKHHRLYQESRESFHKYPSFQERVKKIVTEKRQSSVDKQEYSEFQTTWDRYKDKNEDTVLNALLPFLIKSHRTVKIKGDIEDEEAYMVESFLKSDLMVITNREFSRSCLPLRPDGGPLDKKLVDAMAKEDGMTNPKPDRTYGIYIRDNIFPIGFAPPPEIAVWLEVMRGIHYPFFLIEGKSYQGNLLDAQNEACRGGATLVSAARRLLATLGDPDVCGADTRTFVFSATLSPGLMDIWVHWAEVLSTNELPLYHMNKIMSKAIDEETSFGQLRKALHNILDWGCGSRLADLQRLYPAIQSWTEQQRKAAEEKASAEKAAKQKEKEEKTGNKRQRLSSCG